MKINLKPDEQKKVEEFNHLRVTVGNNEEELKLYRDKAVEVAIITAGAYEGQKELINAH